MIKSTLMARCRDKILHWAVRALFYLKYGLLPEWKHAVLHIGLRLSHPL